MKFGVCGGPDLARVAKACGFDYFEWSVGDLLHPREDESVFKAALTEARETGLPCPVVNIFIPGDLKITGPAVDGAALETYVATALRRAEQAGVERIVFGSGGARRIPDGFDRDSAWQQLVEFCRRLGPVAQRHGVIIAIEPLNLDECNVINTVAEGAQLARQTGHPNVRLLVDGYHWAKDHDTLAGIIDNADLLVHAHVANTGDRKPPHHHADCSPFFNALIRAGYKGRVSIEANISDPQTELPEALEVMKALME